MYLKALEIQGFKSFPEKTTLSFEKDITMIVGPNGSGKSNISDAILWVMGEQRTRSLRGSKMEDVIFGGTEKRSALGMAQVSLILDNSQRVFNIDCDELTITRRYYRSGDSEYCINKNVVRLRDIHELLMDTGLGRDGYSIIGQGRIAEIVSAKSTDRREIFEEAAGISRYRYRKEEAERKLGATDESLLRVGDKIEELEMQLGPLKKQSEVAKKYLVLRDELRGLEISVWMETLDRLAEQSQSVQQSLDKARAELEEARSALEGNYIFAESISEKMREKDVEAEEMRRRLSETEAAAAENESAAAVLRSQKQSNIDSAQRVKNDISADTDRIRALDSQIGELNARLAEVKKESAALGEKIAGLNNVVTGHRMKMGGRENRVAALREEVTKLTVDSRSMDSRIAMLTAMEKEYEGFSGSVRTVMREAGRGDLRGIHGPVANLVRAPERFALAVETALGFAAQNIVTDTQDEGKRAIEYLKRANAGRATFLPLDAVKGQVLRELPTQERGYLGLAYDLVRFDSRYSGVFANLLGRTLVMESLGDAVALSRKYSNKFRMVTLDGQMINTGGSMTGGSTVKGTGAISRANELERLNRQRESLAACHAERSAEQEKAERELAAARYDMDLAAEELAGLRSQAASLEAERSARLNSVTQLEDVKEALLSGGSERRALIESYERRNADIDKQLEKSRKHGEELAARAESQRARIRQITDQKFELEAKRTQTERENQRRSDRIIELEREAAAIERRNMAAQMEEQQLIDKLWDSYELSRSAAQSQRQSIQSVSAAKSRIAELKREIGRLGTPNIGAIDEYARVSERYEFLAGQRSDIVKAKNELLSIIGDITSEMEQIFTREFREISECFTSTFLELFGGGRAMLRLEDEKDPLNCGIEIRVQPPGKAVSSISLLSGGEKSFVAIALYFSILRVKPTPFCVMDEIEAALDEENVHRYAEYLHTLSDKTQFIVITHRRGTMEKAEMLFGVTMQEKGVSRVLELDLAEAAKTAEN